MLSENMENKRLYYIDWLRVLVVLTLIPFHASLTYNASFTIYVFHYLPVTFFTWLFIDLKMHIFGKYLLVVALSYLTVFFICELRRKVQSNPLPIK